MVKPVQAFQASVKNFDQLTPDQKQQLQSLFEERLGTDRNECRGLRQMAYVNSEGNILAGIEFHPTKGKIQLIAQTPNRNLLLQESNILNRMKANQTPSRKKRTPRVSPMEELFLHAVDAIRLARSAKSVRGHYLTPGGVFLQKRLGRFASYGLKLKGQDKNLRRGDNREVEFSFTKIPRPMPLRVRPSWRTAKFY